MMIKFEIENDKVLNIYLDLAGIDYLQKILLRLNKPGDHHHLMSDSWGSGELTCSSDDSNKVCIHKVNIGIPKS